MCALLEKQDFKERKKLAKLIQKVLIGTAPNQGTNLEKNYLILWPKLSGSPSCNAILEHIQQHFLDSNLFCLNLVPFDGKGLEKCMQN